MFFDIVDGFFNTFFIVGNSEIDIQKTDVNIQLKLTSIDTDVNTLL